MTDTGANSPAASKRLVVSRHAKTQQFATSDRVRRLTDRGERNSRGIGRWLMSVGVFPEAVLVSSAARARQTAELMADELDREPQTVVLDELYGATARDVIELCGQLESEVACAAVVGHNPTMAMLADLLLSEDGQIGHFPTSAVAVVDLPGPWDGLEEESGTLAYLHTPHDD
jgi:phosphohistidine phosphatase